MFFLVGRFPRRIPDHRVVVGNERELVKGMAVPRKHRARVGEQAAHRDNGWIGIEHFPEDTKLKRSASSSKIKTAMRVHDRILCFLRVLGVGNLRPEELHTGLSSNRHTPCHIIPHVLTFVHESGPTVPENDS